MSLLRIYTDSSVIGGCGGPEFETDSIRLIDSARRREVTLLFSEITLRELEPAPWGVKQILNSLPTNCWEFVPLTTEIFALRDAYIEANVVAPQWLNDAAHVAVATVAQADAIVSWNFKHIVRLEKIRGYNQVNESLGYGSLVIITPREVRLDERDN